MSLCREGQTPNNECETITILNCFTPDWIWCVRAHIKKKGIAVVAVVVWLLTQELPAIEGGKDNNKLNWTIAGRKFDRSDKFVVQI